MSVISQKKFAYKLTKLHHPKSLIFDTKKGFEILPRFGKIGPVAHHSLGQSDFCFVIIPGFVERITKNEGNFIPMQNSRPGGPRIIGGPLVKVVKVNVVARFGIPVGEIHDRAGEGIVTHHAV